MSKDTDDDDDVVDPDESELERVATKLQVELLSVLKDLLFLFCLHKCVSKLVLISVHLVWRVYA